MATVRFRPSSQYAYSGWLNRANAIDTDTSTYAYPYTSGNGFFLYGLDNIPSQLTSALSSGGNIISIKAIINCASTSSSVHLSVRCCKNYSGNTNTHTDAGDESINVIYKQIISQQEISISFLNAAAYFNSQKSLSGIAIRLYSTAYGGSQATRVYDVQIEVEYNAYGDVTFDSIFNYLKWKNSGITAASAATISNITDSGFTVTSTNSSGEGYTAISPLYTVTPNTSYTLEYDYSGSGHEMFVFCDGQIVSGRFWSTRTGSLTFTVPSDCTTIAVRADSNNANGTVSYSNIRIFPSSEPWRSTTLSSSQASQRTNTNGVWNIPTPTRTGYTFLGWYTGTNGTGTMYTSSSTYPTSDLILWSHWQIQSYTITFVNYDGTVLQSSSWSYGTTPSYSGATPAKPSTAQYDYTFSGWSPSISSVTGAATYTAQFTQTTRQYQITVTAETGGTATGGGTYAYGTTITITATASDGYEFSSWSDGNTTNPRQITVTGATTYTAQFEQTLQTYTITVSAGEGGTATGGGTYDSGSIVTITAVADIGYEFVQWSDGDTNSQRQITVTGDITYVAQFALAEDSIILNLHCVLGDENEAFSGAKIVIKDDDSNVLHDTSVSGSRCLLTGINTDPWFPETKFNFEFVILQSGYSFKEWEYSVSGSTTKPTNEALHLYVNKNFGSEFYCRFVESEEFTITDVQMLYNDSQISSSNKVIAGQGYILKVKIE